MRLVMTEPAVTEATLAWLYWLVQATPHGTYTREMLQHQSKSLNIISSHLGKPDKIQDCSLLWSVSAHLWTNQSWGDWASFEINLNGLDQIVSLLGGLTTLRCRYPLACDYVLGLHKVFDERNLRAEADSTRVKTSVVSQKPLSPSIRMQCSPTGKLPEELVSLLAQGKIRQNVATCLRDAIALLGRILPSNDWASIVSEEENKPMVESALLDFLEGPLMIAEYVLCVGLLIRLSVAPPFGDIRPGMWAGPLASSLVPEFRDIVMDADLESIRGPVLWTCLVIIEMPLNIHPSFSYRLFLLRDIVHQVSGHSSWSENRKMLARIYLDAGLEVLWSKCIDNVLRSPPWEVDGML